MSTKQTNEMGIFSCWRQWKDFSLAAACFLLSEDSNEKKTSLSPRWVWEFENSRCFFRWKEQIRRIRSIDIAILFQTGGNAHEFAIHSGFSDSWSIRSTDCDLLISDRECVDLQLILFASVRRLFLGHIKHITLVLSLLKNTSDVCPCWFMRGMHRWADGWDLAYHKYVCSGDFFFFVFSLLTKESLCRSTRLLFDACVSACQKEDKTLAEMCMCLFRRHLNDLPMDQHWFHIDKHHSNWMWSYLGFGGHVIKGRLLKDAKVCEDRIMERDDAFIVFSFNFTAASDICMRVRIVRSSRGHGSVAS